jgi:hypothetical protein
VIMIVVRLYQRDKYYQSDRLQKYDKSIPSTAAWTRPRSSLPGATVREVGKHANLFNLFIDVVGGQHIPAVRTCPITGGTLCELGEITASYRFAVNLLLCAGATALQETDRAMNVVLVIRIVVCCCHRD